MQKKKKMMIPKKKPKFFFGDKLSLADLTVFVMIDGWLKTSNGKKLLSELENKDVLTEWMNNVDSLTSNKISN